jgi:hypothetical protein
MGWNHNQELYTSSQRSTTTLLKPNTLRPYELASAHFVLKTPQNRDRDAWVDMLEPFLPGQTAPSILPKSDDKRETVTRSNFRFDAISTLHSLPSIMMTSMRRNVHPWKLKTATRANLDQSLPPICSCRSVGNESAVDRQRGTQSCTYL